MAGRHQRTAKPKPSKLLTVSEAADELGVTAATLRNWDKSGKLKARRHPINGYRLYDSAEVEALKHAITHGGSKEERDS